MEQLMYDKADNMVLAISSDKSFIEANTVSVDYDDMKKNHVIPVFVKDNEPAISHTEFIDLTMEAVHEIFHGEVVLNPSIRMSHPIKGRVPDAKHKSAIELLDREKTIYYERMMFVIEVPSIYDEIDGNRVSLTVGGVKGFNKENLYNRKGAEEHFKIFTGFQNKVCTNLCVSTDGYLGDLKVRNTEQLLSSIKTMLVNYNAVGHLESLRNFSDHFITEEQFAHLIGKCRMYPFLPSKIKEDIPILMFGDSHLGNVVKDYYRDNSFCRNSEGDINLWKLYNLFTGSNKSSYVDSFLDRSINAYHLIDQIRDSVIGKSASWYLN